MSTFDQHRLLTMYINQYNQTNTHIDSLLNMLDEIKANIINIIHPRTLINRDTHNHRHHNTNRYNNNRYQNNNNNNNRHNNRHYNNRQDNNVIDEHVSILLNDLVDQVCLQNDDDEIKS